MKLQPASPTHPQPSPSAQETSPAAAAATPARAAEAASPLPPRRQSRTVAFAERLSTTRFFDPDAAPADGADSAEGDTPTAAGMEALWRSRRFAYNAGLAAELGRAIDAAPDAALAAMTQRVLAALDTSDRLRLSADATPAAGAVGLLLASPRIGDDDRTRLVEAIRRDAFRPAADDTLGMNEWQYFQGRLRDEALGALDRAGLAAPEARALLTEPTSAPASSPGKPEP